MTDAVVATPDVAGKFALYFLTDGSAKIVVQLVGQEQEEHTIPAMFVMMLKDAMQGKGPLGSIAGMLG